MIDDAPAYLIRRAAPLELEDEAATRPFRTPSKDLMEEVEPPPLGAAPFDGFVLPAAALPVPMAPSREPAIDASVELEAVTAKAFTKLNEILDLDLKTAEDKEFSTLLRVQMTAVQTVLNTNVRVDEQRMKRRTSDNMAHLLETLSRHEQKMAVIVQVEV